MAKILISSLNLELKRILIALCCICTWLNTQAQTSPINPDTTTQNIAVQYPYKKYLSSFNSEIQYSAKDSIKIKFKDNVVIMFGDAEVKYEQMTIKGAQIKIYFDTKIIEASPLSDSLGNMLGVPYFQDKDQSFTAKSIRYSFDTKKGRIDGLLTQQAEGYIHGERVKKDQWDNMYISGAKYTTCADTAHPHFYIRASRMKVIPGKKIISGPAWLYIGDVPTPGLVPFGYFPITQGRSSGLIMPNYGYSRNRGYFLRGGGYYFGISDNLDMAVTGDIFANLSWRLNATSQYNKRYKYNGNLSIEYAVNKDNEREDPDFTKSNTYFIRWTHSMDPRARPKTTFNANVNLGSSRFLALNAFNPNDIVTNTLASSVNYGRVFKFGNLNLSARQDQNTQTGRVNLTLPDLNLDVFRFFPFRSKNYNSSRAKFYEDIGVTYSTSFRNQLSTVDSLLFTPQTLRQLQYGMLHNASASGNFKILKFIAFSPGVSYQDFWYFSSIQKSWNANEKAIETDTIGGFSRGYSFDVNANFNTIIYGMYEFKKGKLKALRHVVTPGITLVYRPDFSSQNFGFYQQVQADSAATQFQTYSRFEGGIFGGPGRGQNGLLNFNLNNNFEAKVKDAKDTVNGERKVKLLEVLSINGSYNFLADSFQLAPISLQARNVFFKQLNVQFSAQFNPYQIDSTGRQLPKWQLNKGGIARMTTMQLFVTTALNSETLKGKGTPGRVRPMRNPYMTLQELQMLEMPGGYVDFNIPWNFNLNYVFTVNKPGITKSEIQTLNFSGDFKLTEKWKLGFSSGYNITGKAISMTTIDFYRDLHCWEFRFNWMPFGDRQFFNFAINGKASAMQNLRLNRRRDWFDR